MNIERAISPEGMSGTAPPATSQTPSGGDAGRRRTACDDCRARKIRCTHDTATATTATATATTMDPPSPTKTRKTKENARKAAQKKAKKEKKKTMSSQPYQSGSSPARASASDVPPSYLSTFSTSTTSTTPGASASTSTGLPAALLAEVTDDDPPGWMVSWTAAWGQGQKNICIKWVREKREKVVRAEEALAAGHGTDEEVEEAMMELSEEIDDAIRRGCDMSELQ